MRFTLPDDIFESIAHNEAEQEHYFGVPKNVVENDHIPLPPGLSRIRTIRKIHMELATDNTENFLSLTKINTKHLKSFAIV